MNLLTVSQLSKKSQIFSEAAIRNMLQYRKENGLDAAVIKIGCRILIDEDKFGEWLATKNKTKLNN